MNQGLTVSMWVMISMGLSVYMPSSSLPSAYNELAWAKAAQWDEFINWYLAKDADNP